MEGIAYVDLTTKQLLDAPSGSRLTIPTHQFGEELTLGLRFLKRVDGVSTEVSKTVQELRASVGRIDARPETGQWGFTVDPAGTNIDVTGLAHDITASAFQTALTNATLGLGAVTVEKKSGSWLVEFSSEDTTSVLTPVTIDATAVNSLFPDSFIRHRTYQKNGQWVHEFRLIQTPIAFTDSSSRQVPSSPTITTVQDGGSDSGTDTEWPEIQQLNVPLEFRGLFQIRRGYAKTRVLSVEDTVDTIKTALNEDGLADAGGVFDVYRGDQDEALIEFGGDMVGINQDPLEIQVYSAPEGDLTFTLDFNTAELFTLMRREETVTLPFELEADIEDDDDDSIVYTRKLYSGEITLSRGLIYEEIAVAQNIDWLRPPLAERYGGFDYSQVSNGQLHYSTTEGDGTSNPITVDHSLNVDHVDVIVKEISSGDLLVLGTDFNVSVTNANSLTVTPTAVVATNNWRITVLGLEQTSSFDPHTHSISEVTNLQTVLDALGARLTAIENRTGTTPILTESSEEEGISASWVLPDLFEVYPTRQTVSDPGRRIASIDPSGLARPGGLLAAVHDASVEAMPSTVPTPASEYIGRVFENQGSTDISLPGGKRIRTNTLEPGQFAACDGRLWYPVARYGDQTGVTFTTDYASNANQLNATQNELSDGTVVQLTTTGTLPTGLSTGTDYYVVNRSTDSVELATTSGGTPITLTGDGSGTHTITKITETSYYPTNFERELFRIHVNSNQLRLRKRLDLRFALEAAVLRANTNALWTAVIEVGERTQATVPATTGENLAGITWRGEPLLEQQIVVTPVSSVHRLGLRITRSLVSDVDTLTTSALLYGAFEGGKVSPNNNNFVLRGRLIRFDTEDNESDPLGYTVIRGLKVDSEVGASVSAIEGTAIIS